MNTIAGATLPRQSMLASLRDLPNLVTMLGLTCGVVALYLALRANYPAAMIALLWAALCDWYDGPLAARCRVHQNIAAPARCASTRMARDAWP